MSSDSIKSPHIVALALISLLGCVNCVTDPNDFKILNDFRNGLVNPGILNWPAKGNDPCGPPSWPHVFCSDGRVTQLQAKGLGLTGPLPQNFNRLDKLEKNWLSEEQFQWKVTNFQWIVQSAYLDYNKFDTIPSDFFHGLDNIRILSLDNNPFNQTSGWSIPVELAESSQLVNFSCSGCNIIGALPDFFGKLSSLSVLKLSYNRLTGSIPSSFQNSMLQALLLNNQDKGGMSGSLDVVGTMVALTQVWLHGNQFTGPIPDNIGNLTSLKELNLNGNQLVGLIPPALANMNLQLLDLSNNMFMGPIPNFKAAVVEYDSNSFCQSDPGDQCAPEVNALLDFLRGLSYPTRLASLWTGNDPCKGPWFGLTCTSKNQVSVINLQKLGLVGTLSPSLVNFPSLAEIYLQGNHLHGVIPANLTQLSFLRLLDVTGNDFEPPLPGFRDGVKIITDGNPKFSADGPNKPSSPSDTSSNDSRSDGNSTGSKLAGALSAVAGCAVFILLSAALIIYCLSKRKTIKENPTSHDKTMNVSVATLTHSHSGSSSADRNMGIPLQVLRRITNNFAQENELGRGGFGVVYKGELENGTKVAVKRMEPGAFSSKAMDEFQAEIEVLSSVSHRHLVSLVGYSVEGNERLLVYEYMPQRALSRHLFRWKSLGLKPLSWSNRVTIALDVARGVEYLHSLTHQTFIHRDLKSPNILLDDDFRAKVSDFGLVKLAPDKDMSIATRLAGTFGYLAPEYAVTGKITTKVDVYSFGVVLMELLTGLMALDEQRPEEQRYLAEWFGYIKSDKEKIIASIDPALNATEAIHESVCAVAELAGHCTARDLNQRPDMGYAVNVLARLMDEWKPNEDADRSSGLDVGVPLPQMLNRWREDDRDSHESWESSGGSIPHQPSGFAQSFTSADAR